MSVYCSFISSSVSFYFPLKIKQKEEGRSIVVFCVCMYFAYDFIIKQSRSEPLLAHCGCADLRFYMALSQAPAEAARHGHRVSVSHGVPVYFPDYIGTKFGDTGNECMWITCQRSHSVHHNLQSQVQRHIILRHRESHYDFIINKKMVGLVASGGQVQGHTGPSGCLALGRLAAWSAGQVGCPGADWLFKSALAN